jgi:YD repeat-containing protein
MSRQTIKDATGKLLGSVYVTPNGYERGYDSQGQMLGSFDPHTNTTKTTTGKLLTTGNALASLIFNTSR